MCMQCSFHLEEEPFLLLRWGESMSLWNRAANGTILNPPDDERTTLEQRWNDTDRGKPKDSEKNVSQYHFVHQKSYVD
jgi:hypothetical protein